MDTVRLRKTKLRCKSYFRKEQSVFWKKDPTFFSPTVRRKVHGEFDKTTHTQQSRKGAMQENQLNSVASDETTQRPEDATMQASRVVLVLCLFPSCVEWQSD